ncbi:Solute carrier family 41 member 2 like protein [Argiope bruennichi]|uniref:Solute carrier family 41 member 2 like protein n=1 Tax=Argiope bruennichi TaxID=94029 RepID=A0A8T0E7N1_ARGBR|nr:Solute carrier family 41 member 2 like protein [Argiope bruennichi]
MAGEIVDVHSKESGESRCALVRQFSAPGVHTPVPLPITAPGNLQCPLEFWVHSQSTETTPLLAGVPKGPLPPKDFIIPGSNLLQKDDPLKGKDVAEDFKEETACSITCQVFIPFMIAGFGTVAAGLLLDIVQNWNVFQEVPEMFVLVPLALAKGNLEMTLASRISTLANLGSIDTSREQWRMGFGKRCQYVWVEAAVLIVLICLIPLWAVLSYRNIYTRHVLYSGWIPIISAVAISSGGGYILNFAVARFKEIAACQPVINGVGGNLVAVQACRISTYLHQKAMPGLLEPGELCVSPFVAWFGKNVHARTCRILILIAIPGHLIFITCVHFLKSTNSPLTVEFISFYLIAALLQVAILLYMAHCLVHWLWKWGFDPDDAAIPYLTAFGDLLGTAFLFVAFIAMDAVA